MVLSILNRFFVSEDLFEYNLKLLFFVGLWPDETLSRNHTTLYNIYENNLNACMVIFFIITGIKTTQRTDDIFIFLSNIDKSIGSYNYFFKVIFFVLKRDVLKDLIEDIARCGDKVTKQSSDNMVKLLVVTNLVSTTLMVIFSMVAFQNNEMTIEAWMPFDPYKNKMNLALSAQILALLFAVPFIYRGMGMQGMVCSLLIYLCDQLKDLQKKIRNLEYSKGNEERMRGKLVEILKKHIRLLRYAKTMCNIFKEYFFIQNIAISLELCLGAVLISAVNWEHVSVIAAFLVYLGMALLNAYIYCSLGDDLIKQSEEVAQAAFESDWTSWPVDLQKTILLLITIAQRPFKMSAGGIATIDIPNYGTALYNGYSIFAVLNDVVE